MTLKYVMTCLAKDEIQRIMTECILELIKREGTIEFKTVIQDPVEKVTKTFKAMHKQD